MYIQSWTNLLGTASNWDALAPRTHVAGPHGHPPTETKSLYLAIMSFLSLALPLGGREKVHRSTSVTPVI